MADCRCTSSVTRSPMARRASLGRSPSADRARSPASTWSFNPATRTWKNSSRPSEKMARNLHRSSSGTRSSSARSSSRDPNCSHESSRLEKRSGPRSVRTSSAGTISVSGSVCIASSGYLSPESDLRAIAQLPQQFGVQTRLYEGHQVVVQPRGRPERVAPPVDGTDTVLTGPDARRDVDRDPVAPGDGESSGEPVELGVQPGQQIFVADHEHLADVVRPGPAGRGLVPRVDGVAPLPRLGQLGVRDRGRYEVGQGGGFGASSDQFPVVEGLEPCVRALHDDDEDHTLGLVDGSVLPAALVGTEDLDEEILTEESRRVVRPRPQQTVDFHDAPARQAQLPRITPPIEQSAPSVPGQSHPYSTVCAWTVTTTPTDGSARATTSFVNEAEPGGQPPGAEVPAVGCGR